MKETKLTFGQGRQLSTLLYYEQLVPFAKLYQAVKPLAEKIQLAMQVVQDLNQGYLPPALPTMAVTQADIDSLKATVLQRYPTDAVRGNHWWQSLIDSLPDLDQVLSNLRTYLIETFNMYGYVSQPLVETLGRLLNQQPVLEIMAGQGYLTAGLRALAPEQRILATDNQDWQDQPITAVKPVTSVEKLSALESLVRYSQEVTTILLSWAPDTSTADWDVLKWLRKHQWFEHGQLIVIGERQGATNSRKFWSQAHLTEVKTIQYPSFDIIDERLYFVH